MPDDQIVTLFTDVLNRATQFIPQATVILVDLSANVAMVCKLLDQIVANQNAQIAQGDLQIALLRQILAGGVQQPPGPARSIKTEFEPTAPPAMTAPKKE